VRQAESRLARAHVARYQAETSLTADQASYARLVGHMPEQLASVDLHLAESKELDDLLHLAETRNPKVIAARYDIDEAKAEVDLNKGSLLPEINLVGSRTQNWGQSITVPGHQDSSQILVQATMPLYRAGTDYSKTRQAEQTVTARRMDLEEARHKARETAHNAFQTFQSAESAVEADKDEVKAAAEALAGVREESKVGTRTTLDVLNAEQELLDAKIDLAKSLHDRNLAIVQIKAAIGILTVAALQLSVPAYDPEQHYHDVRNQWIGFSRDDDHYQVPPADEEASR
jgi:outer membrane protein